jgi:hypothetical protein
MIPFLEAGNMFWETVKCSQRRGPYRNLKEVKNRMFEKVKKFASRVGAAVTVGFIAAQNAVAQTTLALPADTEEKLSGYITDSFPTVIGVLILVVGVGIIIAMLKRAGNAH